MTRMRWYRSLLMSVCLLALVGPAAPGTARGISAPSHLPAAASHCQWAEQVPGWITVSGPQFPPNTAHATPGVRYAAVPDQAYRVLVDQPTGTVFALSDYGAGITYADSGLLTVLQGATRTPPAWFPIKPPPGGGQYLLGTAVPVADGHGQVYFTCGGNLDQLGPDGRPQPSPVPTLLHFRPVAEYAISAPALVIDESAHRLFTTWGQGFDSRTGTQLFQTKTQVPAVFFQALAADSRADRLYAAGYLMNQNDQQGPTDLYVLNLQGTVLHKLQGFEALRADITQLALAGTTRRLVVFGCVTSTMAGSERELAQVLNLSNGRYLTPKPLILGACGTGFGGSLLTATTSGILAVDAAAGTAVVISYTWEALDGSWPPPPGFAWFLNLRTGTRLQTGTPFGCVQVGSLPIGVAIDSRLHRAYVASSADGLVTILDTRTGRVLGAVQVGGLPASIAVDRHDNQVVVALESFPGKGTTPGGVAFFPATLTPAHVPATKSCAAEGAPFTLGGYTPVSAG